MRSQKDDALSAALRAASETSRPSDDCPAADRIWAAVSEELPPDERLAIIDHTVECPTCAEAWRLAMELGARAQTKRDERPTLISRLRSSGALELASAAVVVFAIGVWFALQWFQTPADPVVRGPDDALARAAAQLRRAIEDRGPESGVRLRSAVLRSEVADGAALPRDAFVLRWSSGPQGARYDLTVTTGELEVIVDERGLEQTEYRIAPERLADVASGTRLLWRVVAHAPDGLTASTRTFEVVVE